MWIPWVIWAVAARHPCCFMIGDFFSSLYILEIISLYFQYFIVLPLLWKFMKYIISSVLYCTSHHLLYIFNGESRFLNQPGFPTIGDGMNFQRWIDGLRLQISDWQTQGPLGPLGDPWGTPRVIRGKPSEKKEVLMVMCVYITCLLISHIWSYNIIYVNPYTTHILY